MGGQASCLGLRRDRVDSPRLGRRGLPIPAASPRGRRSSRAFCTSLTDPVLRQRSTLLKQVWLVSPRKARDLQLRLALGASSELGGSGTP